MNILNIIIQVLLINTDLGLQPTHGKATQKNTEVDAEIWKK